ncbi:ATP-binding protein [Leifsonia sp. YIM 134122]|uniref:ATP-binding protein n=1 Tax=Leifsonia stereocauli TaxID=3134136 RepID=A0ABU9W6H0_9MICO
MNLEGVLTVTLGLPNHLIAPTMSRVIARAAHWFGLVCLAGALTAIISLSLEHPHDGLWPTIVALIPMAILLITLTRHHTVLATVGYLAVGAASTFIYAVTILSDDLLFPTTDLFIVALPVMALVMVGGAGDTPLVGLVWSTLGLLLGETAVLLAAMATGVEFRIDPFAPATYLLIAIVLLATTFDTGRAKSAQQFIHQASRRDSALTARRELGSRATALLHDTALSHLMAVAAAEPGPIDPRLRSMIARDLERIIGQDWLLSRDAISTGSADWLATPLASAISAARAQGLSIDVSGDRSVVFRLDADKAEALGLAVTQCLINVLRHSGVTDADLSVSADEDEVVVAVTDAGVGFVPSETEAPRLGLRHSVLARVEAVGGSVRVWSTPGSGTSVVIVLPAMSGTGRVESVPAASQSTADRPAADGTAS